MEGLPIYNKILVAVIDLAAIFLVYLVHRHKTKTNISRTFLAMVVSMAVWVNSAYLARLIGPNNPELSFWFLKLAWVATPILFFLLYFFVIFTLDDYRKYKKLNWLILILGISTTFSVAVTDWVLEGISFVDGNFVIDYGIGMIPFLLIIFFFIVTPLYILFKKYFKSSDRTRLKIQYFLVGIFIFYLANISFNIILPIVFKEARFYWLGDYSSIFLLGFIAYAIIKRELFGIKLVFTQVAIGAMAVLLLINFVSSETIFDYTWKGLLFFAFLFFGWMLIKSVLKEKKQREKLKEAYEELKKLDEAKTDFINIASHQLRTPISVIKGVLSMMREGDLEKFSIEKKKKFIESMWQKALKLEDIIEDILNASQMTSEKYSVKKKKAEQVDVEEMLEKIVEELQITADKKGVDLKLNKPSQDIPEIYAQKDYLREALSNLIDNALKYTPSSKDHLAARQVRDKEGKVEVSLDRKESSVLIKIKDNGIGIPKEEISNLFQKFSRASNARDMYTDGSGLGLFVVKEVIEGHRGRVWVKSKQGEGSTFFISLPINLFQEIDIKKRIMDRE